MMVVLIHPDSGGLLPGDRVGAAASSSSAALLAAFVAFATSTTQWLVVVTDNCGDSAENALHLCVSSFVACALASGRRN